MGRLRRSAVVGGAVVLVLGVAGVAAARAGWTQRLDRAYAEWSLRWRVQGFWEARVAGDMEKVMRYVAPNDARRSSVGTAVRYLSYEIKQINVSGGVASVGMGVTYKVTVPGFFSESDPAVPATFSQRWVRSGWSWYWEPGPAIARNLPADPAPPRGPAPAGGAGPAPEGSEQKEATGPEGPGREGVRTD